MGVVVGERHELQPVGKAPLNELARRHNTVRGCGVHMKVNVNVLWHHGSIVFEFHAYCGLTAMPYFNWVPSALLYIPLSSLLRRNGSWQGRTACQQQCLV